MFVLRIELLSLPSLLSVDVVTLDNGDLHSTVITEELADESSFHGSIHSQRCEGSHGSIPALVRSWERLIIESAGSTPTNIHSIGSNTESQEDLLEDKRRKNGKLDPSTRSPVLANGHSDISTGRVERVRSLITPKSCKTPEKLVLDEDSSPVLEQEYEDWVAKHFPPNSRIVVVQRGGEGFGFSMVEDKVSVVSLCMVSICNTIIGCACGPHLLCVLPIIHFHLVSPPCAYMHTHTGSWRRRQIHHSP